MARVRMTDEPVYMTASVDAADVTALTAFAHGQADGDQQKRVWEWLLNNACRAGSSTFDPDPSISRFLQGRAQVGIIIANMARTHSDAVIERQQRLGKKGKAQ